MSKRHENTSSPTQLKPGDIEYEMGIPIPGVILEQEQWIQSAIKRLPQNERLQPLELFGRTAPVVVDLGCGNGRFTISSAVRRPKWDHIAVDILPAVVRYGTRRANQRGLSNVRFAVCDGWRFLSEYLAPESVDEIHIYHPQPYADPKQSGRRMLTPDFLVLMHRCLKSGGQVFLQSDRRAYWSYIQQVMPALFDWQERTTPWPEDQHGRSRREVLSIEQGLTIYRGQGVKREGLTENEVLDALSRLPQPDFKIESHANKRRRTPRGRRDRR